MNEIVWFFVMYSTPHFPNLSTFPHHKHLPDDVISSDKPEITQVLKEVTELLGSEV
ncbi:toxin-antitoxin system TumE family protein [Iningainema tapete]|uniref:toxin-antitoxin system TumE family protein n=1 Tax=Iningainema tapete TaxID=2806730 RepID=UPI003080CEC6